jgi:hypothetical protein
MLGAHKLNGIAKALSKLKEFGLYQILDNPLTVSWTQNNIFGSSVSASNNYLVVGQPFQSQVSPFQGRAHIYNLETKELLHTVVRPDFTDSSFATLVETSNTKCIVSSGLQKAYIYNNSTGQLLHTLNYPDFVSGQNHQFGRQVAISESYAIVGAPARPAPGRAYIFNTANGQLLHTLTHPLNDASFGTRVSITETYALVSGFEQVFIFSTQTGELIRTLNNPNVFGTPDGDSFGSTGTTMSPSYTVVSARLEDNNVRTSSGASYIFSNATGELLHTLLHSNSQASSFGWSTAINEDYCIVAPLTGLVSIFSTKTGELVKEIDPISNYGGVNGINTSGGISINNNNVLAFGSPNARDARGLNAGRVFLFNTNLSDHIESSAYGIINLGGQISTTSSITIPSNVLPGDLMVLFEFASSTYSSTNTPTGWTNISQLQHIGGGRRSHISRKIAVSGDENSIISSGLTGASNQKALLVFRNLVTGTISATNTNPQVGVSSNGGDISNITLASGTKPFIQMACYTKSSTTLSINRNWSDEFVLNNAPELSPQNDVLFVRYRLVDNGPNAVTSNQATIGMSVPSSGSYSLQAFRIDLS